MKKISASIILGPATNSMKRMGVACSHSLQKVKRGESYHGVVGLVLSANSVNIVICFLERLYYGIR